MFRETQPGTYLTREIDRDRQGQTDKCQSGGGEGRGGLSVAMRLPFSFLPTRVCTARGWLFTFPVLWGAVPVVSQGEDMSWSWIMTGYFLVADGVGIS